MYDDRSIKYYHVFLYNKVPDLYLVENRRLEESEYTPNSILGERNLYVELKKYLSTLDFSVVGMDFSLPYLEYCFFRRDYVVVNDFDVDGFCYDQEHEKIIYGSTHIYVTLDEDGIYREVITGREIIDVSEHHISEVRSVSSLKKMYDHLQLISQHQEIYRNTLFDIMDKLAIGYRNYLKAYQEYSDCMNRLLKQHEEAMRKERAISKAFLFSKSQEQYNFEIAKIQQLLLSIKDSSL